MSEVPDWMAAMQGIALFINAILVLVIWPIRNAIDELKKSDDKLREDFHSWRVHVASEYTRKDDVVVSINQVLDAVHRLEKLIDALQRDKVDK